MEAREALVQGEDTLTWKEGPRKNERTSERANERRPRQPEAPVALTFTFFKAASRHQTLHASVASLLLLSFPFLNLEASIHCNTGRYKYMRGSALWGIRTLPSVKNWGLFPFVNILYNRMSCLQVLCVIKCHMPITCSIRHSSRVFGWISNTLVLN